MQHLKDFYKNKRVFITGHSGFKGCWLTSTLIEFGSKVMGYSKYDQKVKIFKNICYYNKVNNIYGDILNYEYLKKKLISFDPQIIFHLAAQSLVSESFLNPLETIRVNINGTANILDISKKIRSLNSIVIITSDKCYLNKEQKKGYIETDELGGKDLYSASKASAELIFKAYTESFFCFQSKYGYATARAGNVIGGGDWSLNRIIPDCVKSLKKNKDLIIRNPNSTRPWQHVLEPISGYLLLAKKLYKNKKKYNGSWNFGPSITETMKVKDLVKLFLKSLNSTKKIIFKKSKFKEATLLKLNSKKAINKLHWKNTWNMAQSIRETAYWYSYYLKKKDLKKITNFQIKKFFRIKND